MHTLALWALLGSAAAEEAKPPPYVWTRFMFAAAGWPSGLIGDARVQHRAPLKRSSSFVFQSTYAGVGGRLAIAPAFVDVGPRLSLAPIDFFDIDVQAGFVGYWRSSSGLLPYDHVLESTRDQDRTDRYRDPDTTAQAGWGAYVSGQPTLKAKLGPIILYDSWAFTWFHIDRPRGEERPLVYEPYWDRLIAWDDLIFQQEVGLLGQILDGRTGPTLMTGAVFRHRWTLYSRDPSMVVGGMIMVRPAQKRAVPAIAGQILAYVKDPDRVGGVPAMGLALVWQNDFNLGDR